MKNFKLAEKFRTVITTWHIYKIKHFHFLSNLTSILKTYPRLKLKDNNLKPCLPLKMISSLFFLVDLNLMKSLRVMKLINRYLILHCHQHILNMHVNNESMFSVKKCGIDNCSTCRAPRTRPDMIFILHDLPDPEPSKSSEGHYKTFDKIYGTKTWETFLPSNTTTKRLHGITFNLLKQHANNTQIFVKCHYCNKPCLIFLKLKISVNVTLKFKWETLDLFYICGTSIKELSFNTA